MQYKNEERGVGPNVQHGRSLGSEQRENVHRIDFS